MTSSSPILPHRLPTHRLVRSGVAALSLALVGILETPSVGSAQTREARPASTVTVYAAASLTDAFKELAGLLRQRDAAFDAQYSFAGSNQLALQIEQGAAADVYASADQRWMTYVEEAGLTAGESQLFARNRLVVIVPKTNPARITRLEHLTRRGVKLVLASEAVPVGKYSREALQNLSKAPGFAENYADRVLSNVVSQEENVKAVATKVQLGEADAGMVYRSDVTPGFARHVKVLEIPAEYNVLASYPITRLKNAKNPEGARAFVDLLLSEEGQQVLQRHGLMPVNADASAGAAAR